MMGTTAVLVFATLFLARGWWNSIAQGYERKLYKLPQLSATLESRGRLILHLPDPAIGEARSWPIISSFPITTI